MEEERGRRRKAVDEQAARPYLKGKKKNKTKLTVKEQASKTKHGEDIFSEVIRVETKILKKKL